MISPTRLTQPYRKSGSRAPSAVLGAMKAGKTSPHAPKPLSDGLKARRRATRKRKGVRIMRLSTDPRMLAMEHGAKWTPSLTP